MALRDQLLPATFRGIPFDVLSTQGTGLARRSQLHEYPKRELPYVEDMGAQSAAFTVEAFVRWEVRNALIIACRLPGVGALVHPLFGARMVVCTGCETRDSTDSAGITRVALSFVEAGDNVFPAERPNTQNRVDDAVGDLRPTLQSAMVAAFLKRAAPQWVIEATVGWVTDLGAAIDAGANLVAGATNIADFNLTRFAIANLPEGLVADPEQLAVDVSQSIKLLADLATDPTSALRMLETFIRFGSTFEAFPVLSSDARRAANERRNGLVRLVRGSAAGEAARVSARIPLPSYDAAVNLRERMVTLLDGEITTAGDSGEDATLGALSRVLAEIVRDLRDRGGELARVRTLQLPASVPAVVLAYRLYGDADRDAELIDRNALRHPLFVPAGVPLEVLSA